jgi:hypothetical protein
MPLAVALVLTGVVIAFGQVPGGDAATPPGTIRVETRLVQSGRVDLGRRGRSTGDMVLTSSLVFNRRVTPTTIGRYELVCTFVRLSSRACQGTLQLPRGEIVVSGAMQFPRLYELAVVGGTGIYDNARGTSTVTRLGVQPTRELVVVRLVG